MTSRVVRVMTAALVGAAVAFPAFAVNVPRGLLEFTLWNEVTAVVILFDEWKKAGHPLAMPTK